MNNPRRCILSYAVRGRENYPQGIPRLIEGAISRGHDNTFHNAFLIYAPEIQDERVRGVTIMKEFPIPFIPPNHRDVPYGFKPWMFKFALCLGFDQVLWCDSTIVIHKNLEPIWQIAAREGMFASDNSGCPLSHWTSDDALDKMGCPRDCLLNEIMACAMAFDFRHPKAKAAYDAWFSLCNDGVTFAGRSGSDRKEFRAHRHDQSAISWLCHKNKIQIQPYGLLVYHGEDLKKYPQHVVANTGIGQV